MTNALNSTTKQEPSQKIKLVIFDKFKSKFENILNINHKIVTCTREENITQLKNKELRKGFQTDVDITFLWVPNKYATQEMIDDIINSIDEYVTTVNYTKIPYFAGVLKNLSSIDYGKLKINTGTVFGQQITLEVVSRKAIESIGYFDVRLKDYTSVIDYSIRLANKNLMPAVEFKKTPWVLDICKEREVIPTPQTDEVSSQWYLYKYETLPWDEQVGELQSLTEFLIKLKKGV